MPRHGRGHGQSVLRDVVIYEPAEPTEPGQDGSDHDGAGYPDASYGPGGVPTEADPATTSTHYYNDLLETGVSSDGDGGYISLGDGTFYDFGTG
jgi:hypothetical protein